MIECLMFSGTRKGAKKEESEIMKVYELRLECGHKIQTATLTKMEKETKTTFCPLEPFIKPVKIKNILKVELKEAKS